VVRTPAEAVEAAEAAGVSVVLKAVAAEGTHKNDAGLGILDVATAEGAGAAVTALTTRAKALEIALGGILIAKQVTGGTECVLGVKRDVEMGPVVMFGLGGLRVELFKDVSFAPATLTREDASAMVRATRAGV